MHVHVYVMTIYIYIFVSFLLYPCISSGKSTMIRFWHGTIHFPKIHWLGRTSGRRVRLLAFGCWCCQCELLTAQAPRVVGGVPSWRWSVRTSVSVIKKIRLIVNNEWKQRKYTFVVFKGESASLKANQMKCQKFELLDGGTGHCTKSVYCGETNDEHCFVNAWNHGVKVMGINSVYGLIHDARVCNFCVYCGMKTRFLCCYEFCAVMVMLCLLSSQRFTSLSLCQYI